MQQTITYRPFEINSRLKKPELWIGIIVLTIGLSIVQDYVYSRVQNTGFYLSESLLYNSIWAFLVPLALLQIRLLKRFSFKRNFGKLGIPIVLGGAFTLVHIFIFSTFFVSVSYLAFSPTHHFSHIFNAALSNQFYVLALFYVCIPLIARTVENSNQNKQLPIEIPERINIKIGLKTISLNVESIEFISTEKPYSAINSDGKKYLDNRTLRDFENILNSKFFVRVHRSAIINKSFVKELKSRQNGDYDCILKSGKTVRFSRHYRTNWQNLLQ
ncbi:MAG: LytTR family transcriptional regulator [Flavobacterium sp.]|nr:LytTR family transcriptional regulator [Flavobacterium sp.]